MSRSLVQVRNTKCIGEYVVAVVFQQGIAIEKQRGDSPDQENVESDALHQPGLRCQKQQQTDRREERFDHDSRRTDEHASGAAAKMRSGRNIHIGNGHKQQEINPHFMHFSTFQLGAESVPELVHKLDGWVQQEQQY